ncbi:MAG: XVIPCD domain-containing protein [Lysobacteraceae bacterium]
MNAQFDPQRSDVQPQGGARQSVDPLTHEVHVRPSFADEVRGPAPRDIDLTLARMAQDVYGSDNRQRGDVQGWRPLTDDQFRQVGIDPALRHNASSGFDADVYTDGQGRYALAFRGTDAGKDWATNLGQGLGFETSQYNQAIALSRQAKVAFGDELVITGHSLGGGLAAVGAITADTPAVTFNAAGVKDKTLERVGIDPDAARAQAEAGGIRRYAVDHEILTGLQERNLMTRYLMPDAIGNKVELPDPDPLTGFSKVNPFKTVPHSLHNHGMDVVIQAQERAFGHGAGATGLMSSPDHPQHAQYQRIYDQVQPQFEARGLGLREAQNVAGALTLEAQRSGIAPDQVVANGNRIFAVQGHQPETQRYEQVDLQAAQQMPMADSSRQSQALAAAPAQPVPGAPQQVALQAQDPAQDQANPARGGR